MIDPVASNTGGSTSTNPSPEQTVDKYSDIEIDDIDDSDYVPPEESEGSSDDSQDEEEADKMLIDSQEVENYNMRKITKWFLHNIPERVL
ncbi:hypothetical protein G6F57_009972 [Rhizopus arrhizus]|uniref:Uncharacterized protein n=1 Tax=Rhizopus oryzae TaxID=64495 RepID=A0A9P6X2L3_RHIOR|nr:hypothetical protein G6F23_005699 [Rhizopus arrhizus]KAG1391463.1 hypothetical protein G6F58_012707 [Rhizopus delemar]KAG0758342.1 hypothetical protein G6F24_009866 [Rhizopus arrhizus]KAG0781631.1 hypothetical protein G6F21_011544 [Rhizopus arrhizus]KAG0798983.1 hypothetical protein G6F22_003686 [Rhizopus arrhizus]